MCNYFWILGFHKNLVPQFIKEHSSNYMCFIKYPHNKNKYNKNWEIEPGIVEVEETQTSNKPKSFWP